MPLTPEQLGARARFFMELASSVIRPNACRKALQRLTGDPDVGTAHPGAVRLLQAALAVDMALLSNRKGALPQALGLVERRSKTVSAKQLAIAWMFENIQEFEEETRGAFIRPYASKGKAAEAVVEGFYEAGLDKRLTTDSIDQLFSRHFAFKRRIRHAKRKQRVSPP